MSQSERNVMRMRAEAATRAHGIACGPDGCQHFTISREEVDAMLAAADAAKAKRSTEMPTAEDAVRVMFDGWLRLKEMGWREAVYAPKNVRLQLIEPGSTGIHEGHRDEIGFWIDDGDSWPSRPTHFRLLENGQ